MMWKECGVTLTYTKDNYVKIIYNNSYYSTLICPYNIRGKTTRIKSYISYKYTYISYIYVRSPFSLPNRSTNPPKFLESYSRVIKRLRVAQSRYAAVSTGTKP